MTEAAFSAKLRERFLRAMPGAVVFKHNDRITRGVPDTSVTWRDRTMWLEAKVRKGEAATDFPRLQWETVLRLGRSAAFVVWRDPASVAYLVKPLSSGGEAWFSDPASIDVLPQLIWNACGGNRAD